MKIITEKKAVTVNIICFTVIVISILSLCKTNALCAVAYSQEATGKVAPERDYNRETVTFPKTKTDNTKTALEKSTESNKSSVITKSIIPIIIISVIVFGIFLWICLTIIKKLLPGGKQLFSSPGIEILGRTHFDSQKYLSLVRVGTKILVVGVSQHGFDQISEITDEEEIAELLSATKPKTSTGQNLFYKMFQKQMQKNTAAGENRMKTSAEDLQQDDSQAEKLPEIKSGSKLSDLQERIKKQKFFE